MDNKTLLIADDSENDVELTCAALEKFNFANPIVVTTDGAEALDYLHRRGEFAGREPGNPAVILLDIKMPKVDGLEVLREIRNTPELRSIPVVLLTSSREQRDIIEGYELGVNAYVVKPVDFEQFMEAVRELGMFWLMLNQPPTI